MILLAAVGESIRDLITRGASGRETTHSMLLTMMVLAEFLFLMIEKLSRGLVPPRFVLFGLVGSLGLIIHLAVLNLAAAFESTFVEAQVTATIAAMVFNFVLNNEFTFRDRRLTGPAWIVGLEASCRRTVTPG